MSRTRFITGFTFIEVLVTVAIVAVLTTVSVVSFSTYLRRENLLANRSALLSGLREARSRTLASIGGSQYGVKIDADRFTVFPGSTFSSSTADASYMFSQGVKITTTIPVVVFTRVTGNASASGTIEMFLTNDPETKKLVYVQNTGLINITQ